MSDGPEKLIEFARRLRDRLRELNDVESILALMKSDDKAIVDTILKAEGVDLAGELPGVTDGACFLCFYRGEDQNEWDEPPQNVIPFFRLPDDWPGLVASRVQNRAIGRGLKVGVRVVFETQLNRATRLDWRQLEDWGLDRITKSDWDTYVVLKDLANIAMAELQNEAAHSPEGIPVASQRFREKMKYCEGQDEHVDLLAHVIEKLGGDVHAGDGPVPPNKFRLKGKEYELELIPWRVLSYMWPLREGKVEIQTLMDAVWSDSSSDEALKSAIRRVNKLLEQAVFPLKLRQKLGYLMFD